MTPARWALLIFAALCVITYVCAWALDFHAASQAAKKAKHEAKKAGRHSWDHVHGARR